MMERRELNTAESELQRQQPLVAVQEEEGEIE